MVSGKGRVVMSPAISARKKSGLSQTEFAKLLSDNKEF
jgi:putative transcriptional regulator